MSLKYPDKLRKSMDSSISAFVTLLEPYLLRNAFGAHSGSPVLISVPKSIRGVNIDWQIIILNSEIVLGWTLDGFGAFLVQIRSYCAPAYSQPILLYGDPPAPLDHPGLA